MVGVVAMDFGNGNWVGDGTVGGGDVGGWSVVADGRRAIDDAGLHGEIGRLEQLLLHPHLSAASLRPGPLPEGEGGNAPCPFPEGKGFCA